MIRYLVFVMLIRHANKHEELKESKYELASQVVLKGGVKWISIS